MMSITDEEEKLLDEGLLVVKKDGFDFTIRSNNIICYGEIDFHTSSDDFKALESMNWLEDKGILGIPVPSDYNYEEHCCYSPIKHYRYFDTLNTAIVSQYIHARLGKPKKCCIFKEKIYGFGHNTRISN